MSIFSLCRNNGALENKLSWKLAQAFGVSVLTATPILKSWNGRQNRYGNVLDAMKLFTRTNKHFTENQHII